MTKHRRHKKGQLNRVGRRRRNLRLALLVVVAAAIGAAYFQLHRAGMVPANQTAEQWYEADRPPVELVSLPADDAPHDNYTEWWYYNGHLNTQDGRRFSFHYVIFVINRLAGHTVAHASLVDHQTGQHYTAQQRTAGKPTEQLRDGFDFRFGTWRMAGSDGTDQIAVDTPDFNLNLALENIHPPVLHGKTGLLDFKQAGSSYYYSRPRMRVTGTAGLAGTSQLVSGEAWFDHQWGDFRVTALAWNWFAIQLKDGRDLMLFELFTPQGQKVVHFGTLSGRNQPDLVLDEKDFAIDVTARWLSDTTRIDYPMAWKVKVPSQGIELDLAPVVKNAEFDGRQSSYLIYWEGPVAVSGSQAGVGYVEMSGYQPETATAETATTRTQKNTQSSADEAMAAVSPPAGAPATVKLMGQPEQSPGERPSDTTSEPGSTPINGRPAIVRSDRSNLRAGPGTAYQAVGSLAKGTPIQIIGQQADWLRIVVSGQQTSEPVWIYEKLVDQ